LEAPPQRAGRSQGQKQPNTEETKHHSNQKCWAYSYIRAQHEKTTRLPTLTKQRTSKTSARVRKASQILKLESKPKVHKIISTDETAIKLNGENAHVRS